MAFAYIMHACVACSSGNVQYTCAAGVLKKKPHSLECGSKWSVSEPSQNSPTCFISITYTNQEKPWCKNWWIFSGKIAKNILFLQMYENAITPPKNGDFAGSRTHIPKCYDSSYPAGSRTLIPTNPKAVMVTFAFNPLKEANPFKQLSFLTHNCIFASETLLQGH